MITCNIIKCCLLPKILQVGGRRKHELGTYFELTDFYRYANVDTSGGKQLPCVGPVLEVFTSAGAAPLERERSLQ